MKGAKFFELVCRRDLSEMEVVGLYAFIMAHFLMSEGWEKTTRRTEILYD